MDKTIEQVKQLAHRYGVPKLVLFGSRARGDHRARSDYDFAVWGWWDYIHGGTGGGKRAFAHGCCGAAIGMPSKSISGRFLMRGG